MFSVIIWNEGKLQIARTFFGKTTKLVEDNLIFYDASYGYIAEKENIKLVTQDTDLLK